ncbi:MAG: DUF2079 domain-containing protein [Clostridia bacterium]|nr:DUF2079 domain-containing protein [Clostridia bacterium]
MRKDKIPVNPGFKYTPEIFVRTLVASWFFVSFINLVFYNVGYRDLTFVQGSVASTVITVVLIALATVGLTFLEYYYKDLLLTEYIMVISYTLMSLLMLSRATRKDVFYIALAIIAVGVIVLVYALNRGCFILPNVDISARVKYTVIGVIAFICTFLLAAMGVLRYETYFAPNFDFGIFAQMFYSLKEHLSPITTCERDYVLSHFAVHFSPICYVLLPIYWLFPFPNTLQIAQAVILMSASIPLVLLAKEKGLTNRSTAFLAALFVAYPAVTAGCSYDFHENCFILPLLMWTILFLEKERYVSMGLMAIATLMVKEDAFIYLVILSLFIMISKKKPREGTVLCVGSLVYFMISYTVLTKFGLGIMDDSRYGNLIYNNSGLFGIIRTLVVNPSYVLTQLFVTENMGIGKIEYALELFLPLAFIPFITRRFSRYILLTPVLLNILSMYQYQYDIGFQYSFGIIALIFYLCVLNLADMKQEPKRYIGVIACFATIILYFGLAFGRQIPYWQEQKTNGDVYDKMDEVLETYVPDDASVACTTYIVPHLSQRDEVYETFYHQNDGRYKTDVDYVVLLLRAGYKEESKKEAAYYLSHGYEQIYIDDMLWILTKTK